MHLSSKALKSKHCKSATREIRCPSLSWSLQVRIFQPQKMELLFAGEKEVQNL